jgi:intein-encoded DNA endonuclease-like protein
MIDPITLGAAVSTATQCYSQIKKLIQTGRDIEDMSETVGKWMGAVSDIDNINKHSNSPSTFDKLFNGSVEEVAMKSYSAKIKVQKQREELKNWIVGHYGLQGWDNLLKEEGRIRKARQEAVYAREEQKRMIRDYTIMGIAALVLLSALGWMIWLISKSVT